MAMMTVNRIANGIRQYISCLLSYQTSNESDQRFFRVEPEHAAQFFFIFLLAFFYQVVIIILDNEMIFRRIPYICIDTIQYAEAFALFILHEAFNAIG